MLKIIRTYYYNAIYFLVRDLQKIKMSERRYKVSNFHKNIFFQHVFSNKEVKFRIIQFLSIK